jgi:WD40 repeat protein/serine/threonine protein kinase
MQPVKLQAQCPDCGAPLRDGPNGGFCPACGLRGAFANCPPDAETGAPSSGARSPVSETLPGRCFGDYELLEEIARGGMGVVYRARQLSLNRTVAVKMILAGQLASAAQVQRFRAEAEAAASLQHPNIVAIHEIGEHDGQHFFSMDYVEGEDLGAVVGAGPVPAKRAAAWIRTVAEAIHYAHARGVLHRDLKPSNVLIDRFGQPRVTDFGLAKRLGQFVVPALAGSASTGLPEGEITNEPAKAGTTSDLTLSGQVLGSPNFMPPEQATGKRGKVGPQSDVYSLGAVLFYLVTGHPPFNADTVTATLRLVTEADPLSPRLLNPNVPRDLETVCLKCLEKEPAKRYGTAQELADELGRFLDGRPILARPAGPAEKLWRWCRRKPALAAMGAAVFLLLLTIAVGSTVAAFRIAAARERAEEKELVAKQNEYAADMSLAQQAVAEKNLGRALDLLNKHRPRLGERDLRGWEWHYLWGNSRSDELCTLEQGSEWVAAVAFLPDGKRVAAGGKGGTVTLWDVQSRRATATLLDTKVSRLVFSPNGRWLACSEWKMPVNVLEARTLQPVAALEHTWRSSVALAFSDDGQWLYTADPTEVIRWEPATGRLVERKRISFQSTAPYLNDQFVLAPEGRALAWGSMVGGVHVWDLVGGSEQAVFERQGQTLMIRLEFSPDGNELAVGHTDGSVRIWSIRDQRLVRTFSGHTGFISALAFSQDGKTLATAGYDQTIRLWSVGSGELLRLLAGHEHDIMALGFSPDGRMLVSGSKDGTVRLWDVSAKRAPEFVKTYASLAPVCYLSPDSETALTLDVERIMTVWNTRTLQQLASFPAPVAAAQDMALGPGGRLIATATANGSIDLWNTFANAVTVAGHLDGHTGRVKHLAFSRDEKLLVSAGEDRKITLWDLATKQASASFATRVGHVESLSLSSASGVLAAGWKEGGADFWDVRQRRHLARLDKDQASALSIAVSFDGKMAATGSFLHTVKLWNLSQAPSVREIATLTGHLMPAWFLAFSPDGSRLAVGVGDGEVRLWNTQTGREALRLKGHKLPVFAVGFTPDGNTLVSMSSESMFLWHAAPAAE